MLGSCGNENNMLFFSCRKTTTEDIRQAEAWLSATPLFGDSFFVPRAGCQTLLAQGVLCGIWGFTQQAEPLHSIGHPDQKTPALLFAACFSPDFRAAFHQRAIEFALSWLRQRLDPCFIVSYVYASNASLLNVYKRIGFSIRSWADDCITLEYDNRPFVDASMPLENGMLQYEGDPPFERTLHVEKENGGYNVSLLRMSAHTGTHIDTPAHVGLDEFKSADLSLLHGSVQLIDWSRPSFDAVLSNRILLARAQRGLSQKEAEALVQAGVLLVGIDRLSVGNDDDEWIVHRSLLQNGVIILENANLRRFSAGWYQMRCLPLSIPGSDGIPVRLLLREECP